MKQSPDERNQHRNLLSSKFSADGFLGNDSRPVDEIITTDKQALASSGIDKEKLVILLKDMYLQAKNGFGAPISIQPGITAVFHESMGRIPSPFRGDGVFEKGEVVVTDAKTGNTFILTSLGLHLIEIHDFFQGIGSRYRIDPAEIALVYKQVLR
jgi:hypothetical protein